MEGRDNLTQNQQNRLDYLRSAREGHQQPNLQDDTAAQAGQDASIDPAMTQ